MGHTPQASLLTGGGGGGVRVYIEEPRRCLINSLEHANFASLFVLLSDTGSVKVQNLKRRSLISLFFAVDQIIYFLCEPIL